MTMLAIGKSKLRSRFLSSGWAVFLLGSAGLTLVVSSWFFWFLATSDRTLDLSDEGLYLLAALDGGQEPGIPSPFGAITGPIYRLAGENIFWFRIIGLAVTFLAGAYFVVAVERKTRPGEFSNFSLRSLGVFVLFCVSSYYASYALLTPSYNWASYIGLLLMAGALLYLSSFQFVIVRDLVHYSAFGVGFIFALWSKPSSLVFVLGAIAVLLLAQERRLYLALRFISLLLVGGFFSLGFAILQTSPREEFEKLLRSQAYMALFDPNYELARSLQLFLISSKHHILIAAALSALAASLWLVFGYVISKNGEQSTPQPVLGLLVFFSTWLTYVFFSASGRDGIRGLVVPILMSIIWLGIVKLLLRKSGPLDSTFVATFIVLLGLPLSQALGSNNGFWQISVSAGASIVGIVVATLNQFDTRRGTFEAMFVWVFLLALGLQTVVSMLYPYRAAPIWGERQEIRVAKTDLNLDSHLAKELSMLRACALEEGWEKGNLLLDFSNLSPGIPYFLEARYPSSLVTSVGGYEGSRAFTASVISSAINSEDFSPTSTWILSSGMDNDYYQNSLEHMHDFVTQLENEAISLELVCSYPDWSMWRPARG